MSSAVLGLKQKLNIKLCAHYNLLSVVLLQQIQTIISDYNLLFCDFTATNSGQQTSTALQ